MLKASAALTLPRACNTPALLSAVPRSQAGRLILISSGGFHQTSSRSEMEMQGYIIHDGADTI